MARSFNSIQFSPVIARTVQDAKNDNGVRFNAEKDLIGKSIGEEPTKVSVIHGKPLRRFLEEEHCVSDGKEELATEPSAFTLIPSLRLSDVGGGRSADGDSPTHGLFESRISRRTSRQGLP